MAYECTASLTFPYHTIPINDVSLNDIEFLRIFGTDIMNEITKNHHVRNFSSSHCCFFFVFFFFFIIIFSFIFFFSFVKSFFSYCQNLTGWYFFSSSFPIIRNGIKMEIGGYYNHRNHSEIFNRTIPKLNYFRSDQPFSFGFPRTDDSWNRFFPTKKSQIQELRLTKFDTPPRKSANFKVATKQKILE